MRISLQVVVSCLAVGRLLAGVAPAEHPAPVPYVVITSDTHLTALGGRFPQELPRLEQFVKNLEARDGRPDALIIVGDIVDNAVFREGRLQPGFRDHYDADVAVFSGFKQQHPELPIIVALGPGHDFGGPIKLAEAESSLGPRRGIWHWGDITFIWLTVPRASFGKVENYRNALVAEDYAWLETQLQAADRAVVLFHVPLRTDESFAKGVWPDGKNLTIDPRDEINEVLKRHAAKITAIFCGHIHEQFTTEWNGIPVYFAPFITGFYATVTRRAGEKGLDVHLRQVGSDGTLLPN